MNLTTYVNNSKIIKPCYESNIIPPSVDNYLPLTVFDKVNYDNRIAIIFAYRPPAPTNASIELGLRKTLSIFRPFAGRLSQDINGDPIILLNDEGVKLVEVLMDCPLDELKISEPSPTLDLLHSKRRGIDELLQVQLTRFNCGSLVVGFVYHHSVCDAKGVDQFMIAWGQATRGVDINPVPSFDRKNVFIPREVPQFGQFEHRGVEYKSKITENSPSEIGILQDQISVHKVHYSREFIAKLKTIASSQASEKRPYSTFECLLGYLWRAITKTRGLDEDETTNVKISVNGRMRLTPNVPNYFGNLILWALPTSTVKDLTTKSLSYTTELIRDSIAKVNNDYFTSFIDFAHYKVKEEELVPTANVSIRIYTPNVLVDSWLRLTLKQWDFGTGCPFIFTPSYMQMDGSIFILPISPQDGSVDVVVSLFNDKLEKFKEICYCLDNETFIRSTI